MKVDKAHHDLVRNLTLQYPPGANWFQDFWKPSDGPHVLQFWKKSKFYYWSFQYFDAIARQNDWYSNSPKIVFELARTEPFFLEIAQELNLKGLERLEYERNLQDPKKTVNKDTFPDIWHRVLSKNQENWESDKWKVRVPNTLPYSGLQLAKMGDPEPLREILLWYPRWAHLEEIGRLDIYPFQRLAALFSELPTPHETTEQHIAIARHWLESQWKYDPETMTYDLIP